MPDDRLRPVIDSLLPHARHELRSYQTSKTHLELIEQQPSSVSVVLLGDSMLQRMLTTGASPSLAPWPSARLLPATGGDVAAAPLPPFRRLDGVLNCGVGGDKLAHVAYRLVGDPDRGLPGLLHGLRDSPVRLWVVMAGTNNLHPVRGLADRDFALMRLLLEALLHASPAGCRILVVGLLYRTDINSSLIDTANQRLAELTTATTAPDRVTFFSPPQQDLNLARHLVDHVHLSLDGYRILMSSLAPAVAHEVGVQ